MQVVIFHTTEPTGVISFTNDAGDIEGVTAGSGLTGGGSGAVTLNIGAGTGITVNADDVAVNMGSFDTDDLTKLSQVTYITLMQEQTQELQVILVQ